MPTIHKPNKSSAQPAQPTSADAITLLTADHEKVNALFEEYEQLGDRAHASKQKLANQICLELTRHTTAEEEIFYPAIRAAGGELSDMVDEASVEHASAKELITQILASAPSDGMFDAKVKVLSEYIKHHVQEEEDEMFPKAQELELDLPALGQAMATRKAQIELPPIQ